MADEVKKGAMAIVAAFDEIVRHREPLGVETHHFAARVFLQAEESPQRDLLIAIENLPRKTVVPILFNLVFRKDGTAFVGPARHRLAEMMGKDGMRNFVRQDAGK
jgi:hypothetical protein